MNMESGHSQTFQEEFKKFRKSIERGGQNNKVGVIVAFVKRYPQLLKFRSGLVEIDKAHENFNIISLFSVTGVTKEEAYDIINKVLATQADSLDGITLKWILPQLAKRDFEELWNSHEKSIKEILKCEDLTELEETLNNLRDSLSRIKGGDRSAVVW